MPPLGYVLRDLATHKVHALGKRGAASAWAARMKYKHAYRAILESWLRTIHKQGPLSIDEASEHDTRTPIHSLTAAITAEAAAATHGGRAQARTHLTWPPPTLVQLAPVKKNVHSRPDFGDWAAASLRLAAQAKDERGVALRLAGADVSSTSPAVLQDYFDSVQSRHSDIGNDTDSTTASLWRQMLALEALAAVVWPVVEGLVVVDRLAYLQQQAGVDACVEALFSPATSPRNWVLVANRR